VPVEHAPAKVNLALHVLGRRADGYHELHSLCVFTELGDTLRAEPAGADRLTVGGPFGADLPTGRSNLIVRALEKFRTRFPGALPEGVAIHLDKHLPVAAGLGGGSADAAAALRLLLGLSRAEIAPAALFDLAATLGADVPMCLASRACEISGIGEIVRPLALFPPIHLVLANPGEALGTADVFRTLETRDNPPMPPIGDGFDRAAALSLWLADTRNDLEAPARALVPAIGTLIAQLAASPGCALARMSGSGATVFGLFGSAAAAHQAAQDLRRAVPGAWVAATPVVV